MTKDKARRIEPVKQRLLRDGLPRIEISIILLFTALSGFFTSFLLLHRGVSSMALRYPAAISVAYAVFLLLLRVWLRLQQFGVNSSLNFDIPAPNFNSSRSSNSINNVELSGGDFDGGGAGGSWDNGVSSSTASGNSVFGDAGFTLDLEELWLVILAVVALIGGLLAALYIIYIAPVLLAEILVDGVLVTGLYKSLKEVEQAHWLQTAVKRTIIPAVLAALFFTAAGFAMQKAVPKAHSIGEIWNYETSNKE